MGFVRRHRLALELALLALVAYLAAVLVTTGLGTAVDDVPPAPAEAAAAVTSHAPAPLADYALIAERDLFNPARGGGEGPRSHAGLRLWGVGLQGREARAVIEDSATHRPRPHPPPRRPTRPAPAPTTASAAPPRTPSSWTGARSPARSTT